MDREGKMTVRRAEPSDAGAIAEVRVSSWRSAYRGLLPDSLLDALSVPDIASRWKAWSEKGRIRVFVLHLTILEKPRVVFPGPMLVQEPDVVRKLCPNICILTVTQTGHRFIIRGMIPIALQKQGSRAALLLQPVIYKTSRAGFPRAGDPFN